MKKILLVMLIIASFPFNTCSVPVKAQSEEVFLQTEKRYDPLEADFTPIEPTASPKPSETVTPQPAEAIPSQIVNLTTPETITLSFTGDCTIGDDEKYTWNTFDEVYQTVKDPSWFLHGVKDVLTNDDFTLINFEGTFTRETEKAVKEFRFKGDPSYVDILIKGSIEGVTLANNHSLDYLQKGFEDTVKTLTEANIAYTYFDTYFIKEIKGMKVGFLGYKGWEHEKRSNALLIKQVKEMRAQGVDFIVANYHWGDEKSHYPNALQKRMAHFAIDNGVDLVIGHHPHVLQGMEVYKGKNILYSLGNFCFGGSPNPSNKDTIIYQHKITFDRLKQVIIEAKHEIIPARVSSERTKNNYQPILASGEEEKRILKFFSKISQGLTEK